MGVIYKITSPSGRVYVGQTTRLKKRIEDYKFRSRIFDRTSIVSNSIKKYGWDAHVFEVIEEVDNSLLNEREIYWIATLNTFVEDNPMGMNMTRGGECGNTSSWSHDTERAERMRKLFKERKHTVPKWAAEKGKLMMMRPVLCYSEQGMFIGEYGSTLIAADALGIKRCSVSRSARAEAITSGTYYFRYKKGDEVPLTIPVPEHMIKYGIKRAVLVFLDNIMMEYPSAMEASAELGVPKTTIAARSFKGLLTPHSSGYTFIYKDLFEKTYNNPVLRDGAKLTETVVT
jgi:hypothetical protein